MDSNKRDENLKDIPIYSSMTNFPRPFFGAGGQSLGFFMALAYFGSTVMGLFSIGNAVCLALGILQTWLFKKARKRDSFKPEAIITGAFIPERIRKGYNLSSNSTSPYRSII